MTEADEVERLLAVQLLVARLEVDLRVAARAADGVDVAVVDVHVDAVQLVDEELEAVEVDRDQVVDVDAGELLDGVERAGRPTRRERRVDAVGRDCCRLVVAVDRHDEVAREREQRQRVLLRIGPDEHDRVRPGAGCAERVDPGARVVADDERRRRLRRAKPPCAGTSSTPSPTSSAARSRSASRVRTGRGRPRARSPRRGGRAGSSRASRRRPAVSTAAADPAAGTGASARPTRAAAPRGHCR